MDEKAEPIVGRVVQILNSREIAINIGANAGVKEGMIFAILAKTPLKIKDPETGEVLDELDREKVRVKAMDVRPKISICSTYRKFGGRVGVFSMMESFRGEPPKVETLRADQSEYPPPLSENESFVKTGDRVQQVAETSPD